jgi:hypothetical protein
MDDRKIAQYATHYSQIETEYLLSLWDSAETENFTPEGLHALTQVLQERLGLLPQQGQRYLPSETYFEQSKLEAVALRLETLSGLFLLIAALAGLGFIAGLITAVASIAQAGPFLSLLDITYPIASILPFLQAAFSAIALVFVLRAASQGLLILMDIESNTRPAALTPGRLTTRWSRPASRVFGVCAILVFGWPGGSSRGR